MSELKPDSEKKEERLSDKEKVNTEKTNAEELNAEEPNAEELNAEKPNVEKLNEENRKEIIEEAGKILQNGGLVAFPTETVYGLGADGLNREAVAKIFQAKGRPGDNPLILHISALDQITPLIACELSPVAKKMADAFWPGPLTMIFPKSAQSSRTITFARS